jgi:hypothetical protein
MDTEQIKNSIFVTNLIKMKRVVGLLAFVLLLNGCDDGNVVFEEIAFKNTEIKNCGNNNIFYKLEDTKALILEMDKTLLPSEPTPTDQPTIITINSPIRLVYRFYNGKVGVDNICETIQPATPTVTDQWTVPSGKIQIITTAKKTTNPTDNSTRITGYNHNILFKNITFLKKDGPQTYDSLVFGDYATTATPLPFGFDKTVEQCATTKQIYNYTSSEALTLDDIDPALLSTAILNTVKTGLISTTKNKLTYRLFSGVITADYFCSATIPTTPAVSQEWNAMTGISNQSGIVEVTTTTLGPGSFKHTIVLKKVTLKKGNNDFSLGDNYIYGDLITTN